MTWLGGDCCVPSAVLIKDNTIAKRVKLVIKMRAAGARERTVKRKMIWSTPDICSGPLASSRLKFTPGRSMPAAEAGNRMTDEDKGNKAKERKKDRQDTVLLIFVFVEAVHIFSISSEAFLPDMAGAVTDKRLMFWGETPTRTFRSPVTLTRIR